MPRRAPRHDHDAGGHPDLLAAKADLRDEVWQAMRDARVARFPGAVGRIPNFTGAEAAAERLRATDAWRAARTIKSNPDSAQWPVRQRALEDGKVVFMAVPRLAEPEPFFLLDPQHLADSPRAASSIKGASRSARRVSVADLESVDRTDMIRQINQQVSVADLESVDLVVTGCVAAGKDGARLGKGGGYSDLEYAVAAEAGLVGDRTVVATTVHELQVRTAGAIPTTDHDVRLDLIVTPERVIDCRPAAGPRPHAGIRWDELTEEKIAAIPLLAALRVR